MPNLFPGANLSLLFPTTTEFLESWPAEAARGRTTFVLRYGLGWAAIALALIWLANWALGWDHYPLSARMPTRLLILELVLVPLGGFVLALLIWKHNIRRYRGLTEDQEYV